MHVGKLQRIGESHGVILPAPFIRQAGWHKGDYIAVDFNGKEFKLYRVKELNVAFRSTDGRERFRGDSAERGE